MHPIARAVWLDALLLSNVFSAFVYSLTIEPHDPVLGLLHSPHLLIVYSGFLHLKDPTVLCAEQLLHTSNVVVLFFDVLSVTYATQRLSSAYGVEQPDRIALAVVQLVLSVLLFANLGYLYWAQQFRWSNQR